MFTVLYKEAECFKVYLIVKFKNKFSKYFYDSIRKNFEV